MPFKIILQYLLPQKLITICLGFLAEKTKWRQLKNWVIKHYIKHYDIDMSLAVEADPSAYSSFNAFFARAIKPELRPIEGDDSVLISPADGVISEFGSLKANQLLQAKGCYYSVDQLVPSKESENFHDGLTFTVYLSPRDYHRVHMPMAGTLRKMIYVPGKLFSVNPLVAEHVPNVFARNERLVCLFDTAVGSMAVVMVGAMIVASITTSWAGKINKKRLSHIQEWIYPNTGPDSIFLTKGAEMGYFSLGSTVIVLLSPQRFDWNNGLVQPDSVIMGQTLGQFSRENQYE